MTPDAAERELVIAPVAGVELAAATAGLKKSGRADVALIRLPPATWTAAVFTRNAFAAAPILVAREHLAAEAPQLLVINSGCANAGTGTAGVRDARAACQHAAQRLEINAAAVLPFSTGVIGERLQMERLRAGIDQCVGRLHPQGWSEVADAIMTTDTRPKGCSRQVVLSGGRVGISGIVKGAGMIRPDMATMLAFIATDAEIDRDPLEQMLRAAMDDSFHSITVDGDTSTNDAVTLSATGVSGVRVDVPADRDALASAIVAICIELAQAVVRDAEGATRLIEIAVRGGTTRDECRAAAFAVAHSPLVKTAVFGGDPNWGRILAAVGRAAIDELDIGRIDIGLGDIPLVRGGEPAPDYDGERAAQAMWQDEIRIRIDLGRGGATATVWTSDLSYEYVRVNADYRT